jgi:inner membrane transporter RhtA
VAAIEFVGTIGIALWGLRTGRNYLAFAFAIVGVALLIDVPTLFSAGGPALTSDLLGLFWAVLNGSLFVLYILLGHKLSEGGASGGVERLGAAMMVAFLFVMPIGFLQALDAFGTPLLVLAGIGVGICSSVIPDVCDQLAMSRLPRSSYAFLLTLLPATATIIGVIVLRQIPSIVDVLGVLLVMVGVAIHKPPKS